jgi:hypothetical protein
MMYQEDSISNATTATIYLKLCRIWQNNNVVGQLGRDEMSLEKASVDNVPRHIEFSSFDSHVNDNDRLHRAIYMTLQL